MSNAAQIILGGGDPYLYERGRALQLNNRRVSDMLRRDDDAEVLNRRVGGMLATGDRAGAQTAAYQGGADMGLKLRQSLNQMSAQEQAMTIQGIGMAYNLSKAGYQGEALADQMDRLGFLDPNDPKDRPFYVNTTPEQWQAMMGAVGGKDEQLVKTYDPASGKTVYTPRSQAAGMQAPPPTSPISLNMPQFGVIGEDQYGNPVRGFIDRANQSVTPLGGQPGQPATPMLDIAAGIAPKDRGPGWRNEEFLKTLPSNLQTQVRALSEGRLALPTGRALTKPFWQKLIDYTGRYDPSFDANDYKTRYRTRADFAAGVAARNITAHNTALKHIAGMTEAVDALENTGFPSWNALANWAGQQGGNAKVQSALGRFNTVKKAVADEMAKVFAGSNSALADREAWEEKFSSSDSPAALKAAIGESLELLHARLVALADQYNRGMGQNREGIELLAPEAREALEKAESWLGNQGDVYTTPVTAMPGVKVRRVE